VNITVVGAGVIGLSTALAAGLVHETLTEFLNETERGVFEPDDSGTTVTIEAGGSGALLYVLLHESTHAA
jgi:hypothetical protein